MYIRGIVTFTRPPGDNIPVTVSLITHSSEVKMTDLFDRMLEWIPLSLTDKLVDFSLPAEARMLRWCLYLQGEGEMVASRCAWHFLWQSRT